MNVKGYLEKVNKLKIKQYVVGSIAVLFFVIGFVNYRISSVETKNNEIAVVAPNENEDFIGDVELVNSGSIVENEEVSSDYFESIRIDRDAMYSRMLETYNKMINNENLAETQKAIAVKEIEKITENQNAIMISENLIKNKGYEDAVVLANVDIINVIVKSPVLSNEDISKIQNIIEREFKVSLDNVNISNKI